MVENRITVDEAKKAMLSGKDAYEVIQESEKEQSLGESVKLIKFLK